MTSSMIMFPRGDITPHTLIAVIDEINTGTDRAVAIVGGALLEHILTDAIKTILWPNKKITDELFKVSGALGAYATKIRLGLLIGLYGEAAYNDFIVMKDIRNAFAHKFEINDFQNDQIKGWCKNLTLCERYTIDTQGERPPEDKAHRIGDRAWWFGVTDRDAMLSNPRERYIVGLQVLMYGLAVPHRPAMPQPQF